MTNVTPTVANDGKNDGKKDGKEGKVGGPKPSKKELFERYFILEAKRQKAEAEVSMCLKVIKDHYGKGPFRLPDGDKTIVERKTKNEADEVIKVAFFLRSADRDIQEIE